jgi:hypothetical protein
LYSVPPIAKIVTQGSDQPQGLIVVGMAGFIPAAQMHVLNYLRAACFVSRAWPRQYFFYRATSNAYTAVLSGIAANA